ncbi:type II secretion system F family protein [Pseudodesulfovibrio sp. F-1]|uniref:Type II secretion system F family protein n=2 Tax=Pseudodesulfovibrio alkaliphilus TaxID=2661613 RepID=A0A7K1KRN6_9BACT|nr:type II secretion system F family protein [Pseudodesulfovibrio alkaliphilus]
MMLGASGLILAAFFNESRKNPLETRLGKPSDPAERGRQGGAESIAAGRGRSLPPWVASLAELGEKLAGTEKSREDQRRLLTQAGFRQDEATGLFMIVKTGLGLSGLVMALAFGGGEGLSLGNIALAMGAFFAGGVGPEMLLKARAAARHNAITRSMPDALDLMVICAEAGLPFTRIMKVVSKELELSAPVLADELSVTSAELQLLPDRTSALRHLAERTMVPTVESMVATLIQAERYGTPLAQALNNIAAESRNSLILTLEERAGKLPAKLSIPLMTMILPPVVALVATPALMRVIRSLLS